MFRKGALVAALAAAAMAGCGSTTLETSQLEQTIKKDLEKQGAKNVTATCPDDVEAKKGVSFTCKAKSQGEEISVKGTQVDDEGNVEFAPVK